MWAAEMGLPPRAERTNADLAGGALSAASGPATWARLQNHQAGFAVWCSLQGDCCKLREFAICTASQRRHRAGGHAQRRCVLSTAALPFRQLAIAAMLQAGWGLE